MEDMKKLYESKISDLSNEFTACMCKLDGSIEKIAVSSITGYKFIYGGQEVFAIIYYNEYKYEIKVCDKYTDDCTFLNVASNNSNIAEVYNIMEKKYNEHEEYSKLIEPINSMIKLIASYTDK